MNIIKKIFNKLKKEPKIKQKLDNADILISKNEKLTRIERRERFDNYYKAKDKQHWDIANKK